MRVTFHPSTFQTRWKTAAKKREITWTCWRTSPAAWRRSRTRRPWRRQRQRRRWRRRQRRRTANTTCLTILLPLLIVLWTFHFRRLSLPPICTIDISLATVTVRKFQRLLRSNERSGVLPAQFELNFHSTSANNDSPSVVRERIHVHAYVDYERAA